jgi:hypothetical protein
MMRRISNMFTWNHRVIFVENDDPDYSTYRFVEVHYDENNKPQAYGEPFMVGNTPEEMQELVDRLQKALTQPVLTETDFEEASDE